MQNNPNRNEVNSKDRLANNPLASSSELFGKNAVQQKKYTHILAKFVFLNSKISSKSNKIKRLIESLKYPKLGFTVQGVHKKLFFKK